MVKDAWKTQHEKDALAVAVANRGKDNQEIANAIYAMLEKKYDWRRWMVLVYDASPPANADKNHKIEFCDGFAKYEYHGKNILVASNGYDMGMMPGHEMRRTFGRIPVTQSRCSNTMTPGGCHFILKRVVMMQNCLRKKYLTVFQPT